MPDSPGQSKRQLFIRIPSAILSAYELKPEHVMLTAYVAGFNKSGNQCFASNSHLAGIFNVSDRTVSRWVTEIIKSGWLISRNHTHQNRTERHLSFNQDKGALDYTSGFIRVSEAVLSDPSLTPTDKLLIALVEDMEGLRTGCILTNAEMGARLHKSEQQARKSISKLIQAGYLKAEGQGRSRRLMTTGKTDPLDKNHQEGRQKPPGSIDKNHHEHGGKCLTIRLSDSSQKAVRKNTQTKLAGKLQIYGACADGWTKEQVEHGQQLLNRVYKWGSDLPNFHITPIINSRYLADFQHLAESTGLDLLEIDSDDILQKLERRYRYRNVDQRSQPVNLTWLTGRTVEDERFQDAIADEMDNQG